jgi:hypothetical protein
LWEEKLLVSTCFQRSAYTTTPPPSKHVNAAGKLGAALVDLRWEETGGGGDDMVVIFKRKHRSVWKH